MSAVQTALRQQVVHPARQTSHLARRLSWAAAIGTIVVLVGYPVARLAISSFQGRRGGWTLDNYALAISDAYVSVIATTLAYTALSTVVALLVGVPIAWAVARTDMPLKWLVTLGSSIAFVSPPFLQSMAYVFLFSPNNGYVNQATEALLGIKPFNIYSMAGMVLVTAVSVYPQVLFVVSSAMHSVDPSLEEAAVISGARRWQTASRVLLPLVLPAILTSAVLTFVHSMALFGVPAIIGLPAKLPVLTTRIYQLVGTYPPRLELAAALSLFFLLITVVVLWAQHRLLGSREYTTISGRGLKPRQQRLGRWRYVVLVASLLVVGLATVLPFFTMLAISLMQSWGNGLAPSNLTAAHYTDLLMNQGQTQSAMVVTFVLAVTSVVGTLVLGLVVGYLLSKTRLPFKGALRFLAMLPLSIPGVVFTIGVMSAYIQPPVVLYGTIWILIVAYLARFLPYTVQPVADALNQVDDSLLESAHVCGASWGQVMRSVLVPLVRPSLFATGVLVFMASLRELVTAIFLYTSSTQTVLINIYSFWTEGYLELASALSIVLLVIVAALYLVVHRVLGSAAAVR